MPQMKGQIKPIMNASSVGSALTAYAAGTGDWDGVVTAFVDGWAKEYKLANG